MSSEMTKKSPKKPRQNAARQEEISSSTRDGNDVLGFDIVRRPRSSRDAMKEMDTAETLLLLQVPRGKNTYPVVEIEERLSHSDAVDNADVVRKDNQKLDENFEFDEAMAVINLMNFKPERNSASGVLYDGTEKCANEVEELELTRSDDGQGLVDFPENSALMELKWPKLDLKVSDKSENPASYDAQGNNASGKQTPLTEQIAREADQEPEQKLDSLEEQAAKVTTSVDEPGTDNPVEESGADNSDEMLTSCSGKSSCSVGLDRGDEITSDMLKCASGYPYGGTEKSGNEAPFVEEEEVSRKVLPEKSAAIELKKPKLDHEVFDNSVGMQEEKQKVDISAPAPSDSSEEERSSIIDGQTNETT